MCKEHIHRKIASIITKLRTLIQHEAKQALCDQLFNNPADGQPIPSISMKHQLNPSMTPSKETKDDAEM